MEKKHRQKHRPLLRLSCLTGALGIAILGWLVLRPAEVQSDPEVQGQVSEIQVTNEQVLGGVAVPPPLSLTELIFVEEYQRTQTLERWKLTSELSCPDFALKVLESIYSEGHELVHASFMDLSGECWGCVFKGVNGESLSVLLIPQRPFSPRSDTNLLTVTILHYLVGEDLI